MKLIFLILLSIFSFCSCSSSIQTRVENSLSEIRYFVLTGSCDDVRADIMCGNREVDYVVNGVFSGKLIPFGILTLRFKDDTIEDGQDVNYTLFVGTKKYLGICEQNPFDGSYVVDVKEIIDYNQNVLLEVKVGDDVYNMKLCSPMDDWTVDSNKALQIFVNSYSKQLRSLIKEGVFCGETYVKIIGDYDDYSCEYLYCVSCVGRNDEKISMIISPKTGKILASSSNLQK